MKLKRTLSLLGRAAILLSLTMLLLVGYEFSIRMRWRAVFWIYFAALALCALVYVVYRRGFSRTRVSREMLPADWTEEQKDTFFAEEERWRRRARPLLYLLVALCLTFAYDIFRLFFYDALVAAFPFLSQLGGF